MTIVPDCLGMEFELLTPDVILNLKDTHTAERDIKGIDILGDGDMYLKLTLDPRTTFDGNADNQHMAFEFILDHTQCPIDTMDFTIIGRHIQTYISNNSLPMVLKDKLIDEEEKIKIPGTGKGRPAKISPEHISAITEIKAMVHVTCACPLKCIGKIAIGMDRIDILPEFPDEIAGFLFLVDRLWAGAGGNDTKQKMQTMNRTSFGAIFDRFSPEDKDFIMDKLRGMSKTDSKISPTCTIGDFYTYLNNLKNGKTTVGEDPTYKANENMFLGVSALGDTFVQKEEEFWPIFEFRTSGSPHISYISEYFKNIKNELDGREFHAPNFARHAR